ncbi:NAD(P)/FAD-dependent oxidoreductase [Legionella gresilensis]|uniref:NAD(P)/FAD-dependent oxidoreductase n=1 Tax=Legionella gresilensis TaxID=91823 RepID=UPI00104164D0|nr:FAD-binding oxidoreductase [Legionella gresilensis]
MTQVCFEVTIVGAGMFGSAAAKYLSAEQTNIALIGPEEPIDKLAASSQRVFGAHYDQARITRRLGWDEVWAATDSKSLNRYRDIEKASGIPFFYECGSLILMAKSISSRTEVMLDQCKANDIPIERMTTESMEHHWPYLKIPQILGGVEGLYEDQMAGYLNPRKLVKAQLSLFQRNGGNLIRGTVTHVKKNKPSNLWQLDVTLNGKIQTVYTKKILIAAGAFINHNEILPPGYKLELHSFTEPNLLFEVGLEEVESLKKMPTIITVDPEDTGNKNMSIYLLPPVKYPDDKYYIRIGPGMQPIVEHLDSLEQMRKWYIQQQITTQQRDFLLQMQQILLPNIKPKSIKEACCVIEKTPIHYPYIGQINEDSSLNVVVGGNGHGARGSDEIGRLAAGIVMGHEWDFPIEQSRFKPILITDNQLNKIKLACKPPFGLC